MKRLALCVLKDPKALLGSDSPPTGWELRFAQNRQCALEAFLLAPFQAVVTDDPWQKGAQADLLADLALVRPDIVRIRLYSPVNKNKPISGEGHADQCVPTPCTVGELISAIQRANLLRRWLVEPAMSDLLPRIQKVPSIPALYFRLLQILETGQTNLEEVGNIMAEDFAVTAKLLQMVNSPFFGLQRTVKSPVEAVAHLGLSQTRALVLLAHAFSGYNAQKDSKFSLERLWQHSTSTAKLARAIIEAETADAAQAELAFTAGLLHDVGKLFHAANCPKEYNTLLSQAERNDMLYVDVERHLVGTTHAELGACVLATWGLPAEILEVIAFHHAPGRHLSNSFGPLTAVHVANAFEHELNSELTTLGFLDHEYLKRVGCESRLALWIERCCAAPLPLAA